METKLCGFNSAARTFQVVGWAGVEAASRTWTHSFILVTRKKNPASTRGSTRIAGRDSAANSSAPSSLLSLFPPRLVGNFHCSSLWQLAAVVSVLLPVAAESRRRLRLPPIPPPSRPRSSSSLRVADGAWSAPSCGEVLRTTFRSSLSSSPISRANKRSEQVAVWMGWRPLWADVEQAVPITVNCQLGLLSPLPELRCPFGLFEPADGLFAGRWRKNL